MKTLYEPAIHFQQVSFSVNNKAILKTITGSIPKAKLQHLLAHLVQVKQRY